MRKNIIAMAVAFVLMASTLFVPTVKAAGDGLEEAKNGVVQINCVYVDDSNNHYILKGAAGILSSSVAVIL